jgi:hypothetical protein
MRMLPTMAAGIPIVLRLTAKRAMAEAEMAEAEMAEAEMAEAEMAEAMESRTVSQSYWTGAGRRKASMPT